MKSFKQFTVVFVIILAFVVGVLYAEYGGPIQSASAAFDFFKPRVETKSPDTPALVPDNTAPQPVISKVPTSFVELVKKEKPAVVNISTTQVIKQKGFTHPPIGGGRQNPLDEFFGDDFFKRFFGDVPPSGEFKSKSLGSGFIISADGYILTNNHVIENASEIKVKLTDEKEYDAKIIGRDAKTDIALIKIEDKNSLPVVNIGDSDKLEIGEWVVAIGNPFGLEQTVTAGIVSAKGRVIGSGPYDNFIQTDASINPGNSGGPLFNTQGEVVGINTAIVASGQGIGFAIPINMAREILPQLRETGTVTRGWLGVMVQHITPDIAESLNLQGKEGALVADVVKGGPAEKTGIRRGDVIMEFDGKQIGRMRDLPSVVASTPIGKEVKVLVLREGKEKILDVTITKLDEEKVASAETEEESGDFGMKVQEITPEVANYFNLEETAGVVVVNVERDSAAAEAGMQPGDLILEVNQRPVRSLKEYRDAISLKKAGEPSLFWIKRGDNTLYFAIRSQAK